VFDHIVLRVPDLAAVEPGLTAALGALGITHTHRSETAAFYGEVLVGEADERHPLTHGLHIAFVAPSRAAVDAYWQAGVDGGLRDNGAPGPRPQYADGYYAAYLLDHEGNNLEAVHRDGVREDGELDHITLRVHDLAASTAFFTLAGAAAGFRPFEQNERRTLFNAPDGGVLALLAGTPSEDVHVAFTGDAAAVEAFHANAVAAGHVSNGEPGERAQYGAGSSAAFVIDPDGNNIEVVARPRA
jgi:catechol 2,3-dioxygenase-like lactoylglutathione lyase family enzyme